MLAPTGGRWVTRQPLLPPVRQAWHWPELVRAWRQGTIDPWSFGMGMRLFGFEAEDPEGVWPKPGVLDNARVFALLADKVASGLITQAESDLVTRFKYLGANWFESEADIKARTQQAGLRFAELGQINRAWSAFYPVWAWQKEG